MLPTLFIAFISFFALVTIHELGHFVLAKKFGVKVEEFGIGYPPRITGKQIGETFYSLNLLPFGAFVRMEGELEESRDPRSFFQQKLWKRLFITLGGIVSFWIVAAVIFGIIFLFGAPVAVEDDDISGFSDPRVSIVGIAPDSPAQLAGLEAGDIIKSFKSGNLTVEIDKISQVKEITTLYQDKEITLIIERGENIFEFSLTPRSQFPQGEGPMGVALVRIGTKVYPWYQSFLKGISLTGEITVAVIEAYIGVLRNLFVGKPLGVEMVGPVGVFQMMVQTQQLGTVYFLNFIALISIQLAIFNALPIPAVDGGRVLFLAIEAIRKKPVSEEIQQRAVAVSFLALIVIMILVTIKDIGKFF